MSNRLACRMSSVASMRRNKGRVSLSSGENTRAASNLPILTVATAGNGVIPPHYDPTAPTSAMTARKPIIRLSARGPRTQRPRAQSAKTGSPVLPATFTVIRLLGLDVLHATRPHRVGGEPEAGFEPVFQRRRALLPGNHELAARRSSTIGRGRRL